MSAAYVCATQLLDHQVLAAQLRHDALERDHLWALVDKTTCKEGHPSRWMQQATITFKDRPTLIQRVEAPRGVDPALTNEEILQKWRELTDGVIDNERRDKIEKIVLALEDMDDVVAALGSLLEEETKNPIA